MEELGPRRPEVGLRPAADTRVRTGFKDEQTADDGLGGAGAFEPSKSAGDNSVQRGDSLVGVVRGLGTIPADRAR